jgi:hypothetical protein
MTEAQAPPKTFEHCMVVFESMRKASAPAVIEGKHALVYEGFLTRLFAELHLATPYYTKVMRLLKEMECVRQLSRGGGNSPSRWELLKEPDPDAFDAADGTRVKTQTKLGQALDSTVILAKRVDDLEMKVDLLIEERAS